MEDRTRREKIEAMLGEDPHDHFLKYSLALELEKEDASDRSLELLTELTQQEPPYIPAFFMAGQQLARRGRIAEARGYLRPGIEAARSQGDDHAASEMSEFLASLGKSGE